jgi:3-deoxy-manno-octulosonate cytidylyltransferase (CMP-KDO synthetase)
MNVVGIIPSRLAASRFPNKPMALIHGMPMIGHCFNRAKLALGEESIHVATCDEEIARYIKGIGGGVIMTSVTHKRATTRTAEAVDIIEAINQQKIDIVVMIQGDEPLINPMVIAETLELFSDPKIEIVNVMSRLKTYEQFVDKNNVKVVVNCDNDAIYFSREPIPSPWHGIDELPMYQQTGIIVFRRNALARFNGIAETSLEKIESIDMNRIIETGGKIRMVLTESTTIGVDTQKDLNEVQNLMLSDSVMRCYLDI